MAHQPTTTETMEIASESHPTHLPDEALHGPSEVLSEQLHHQESQWQTVVSLHRKRRLQKQQTPGKQDPVGQTAASKTQASATDAKASSPATCEERGARTPISEDATARSRPRRRAPPLPRTDMKIIIRPAPGLILRKLQTHQVARAIVQATGGAPTCKGDDFITRLRPGSNIIIVSTPHEGTAATLMKIMSLTFHGRSQPVKVYLSTPEDLLKGVVHGIDVGTSEEELMANLRVRTHGSTSKQQQQGAPIIAAPKNKGSQQNQRKTKEASPKRTNTKEQESPTSPSISCRSSSSNIAAENQRFSNSGSELILQPPLHQSQAYGSSISTSLSSAFHSAPGSKASKTEDEAASAAAVEPEVRGDNPGNLQYADAWDTDPAAMALWLLRVEYNRNKSPIPAHTTPAAKGAPATNEMTRQPVYETALDPRLKQREPDQGPDRPAQSPAITLPGPQQQPRAGPLHPVPPSPSPIGLSATPGHTGGTTRQPPRQDARHPKPPPHQGNSRKAPVSSSTQQQPAPTPPGSSSSDDGNPSVPTSATRDHDPAFRQASAAVDQNHQPPWSPTSENARAVPAGAVTVKRSIHAGVKAGSDPGTT
ncbi:hypothetical protein HPB49_022634 [Dermacentor silvarum]|uniref:Uncharacterized protein n=1 Tax=Dermacentor silvarum TaxID=543639 RepID=A0ACB8C5Q5_DERSI|nr:hypothetical protein HPB49_022634 [Dermacentor silvarum]